MTTTKTKKKAKKATKKKTSKKAAPKDPKTVVLGTPAVNELRDKARGKASNIAANKADEDNTFMHEQRELDAEEAKLGDAAKHVKQAHLLSREACNRLANARMATSTQEAIKHDLERVRQLADDIATESDDALKALAR